MTSSSATEIDPRDVARLASRVGTHVEGPTDGRGVRVGVVCARFNGGITTRLLEGALDGLLTHGVAATDVVVAWAPGAFELPLLARALVTGSRPVDVVITLGAVVRGETGHYELVAGECARGVQEVQLATGVPVVFGVLTTNTVDQAFDRCQPDHTNKGREAALTALEMVNVLRHDAVGR